MPTHSESIRFNNVEISDINVFQRRTNNNNHLFEVRRNKPRLMLTISTFANAIISFVLIIVIIKITKKSSRSLSMYNELNKQYDNIKQMNNVLIQKLEIEVKGYQELETKLTDIKGQINDKENECIAWQIDNNELIKELRKFSPLEKDIEAQLQVFKTKNETLQGYKAYNFRNRRDLTPFLENRMMHGYPMRPPFMKMHRDYQP